MNHTMRRRQFSKLAFASTAITALGFAGKVSAQTSEIIYSADLVSGKLVLQSLNVVSGAVVDLSSLVSGLKLESGEKLTGLAALTTSSFALTSVYSKNGKKVYSNFLLTSSQKVKKVSGLSSGSIVESLVSDNKGSFISLVSLSGGGPPFALAKLDTKGKATLISNFRLPPDWGFGNLTLKPNGLLYATGIGPQGYTCLVSMNLPEQQLIVVEQLRVDNSGFLNDLTGLAYSPSSQLYAAGNPTNEKQSLFTADINTGALNLLQSIALSKISFVSV